jgi:hypothetical protein
LESVFLMLAFLALARLPSLEQLRYGAPGEWGKRLGLDRIPAVRTLRNKIALLSDQRQANAWSAALCAHWMGADPDQAAVWYPGGGVVRRWPRAGVPRPSNGAAASLCRMAEAVLARHR